MVKIEKQWIRSKLFFLKKNTKNFFLFNSRVRKQVVNIPSFIVRLDSQKHIDFSLKSPFGGGRPGRVKRKNMKKEKSGGAAGDDDEE